MTCTAGAWREPHPTSGRERPGDRGHEPGDVEHDEQVALRDTRLAMADALGELGVAEAGIWPAILVAGVAFAVPQFSAERTRVTVDVAPLGAGCELALTHEGVLPDYEARTAHGWDTILAGLAATLGEGALTEAAREP